MLRGPPVPLDPGNVRLIQAAADALENAQHHTALAKASQAIGRHGPSVLALRIAAKAQERLGDLPAAFASYEAALRIEPDSYDLMSDLATLANRIEAFQVAEQFFARMAQLRPSDLVATFGLADALRQQNRLQEAQDVLTAKIETYDDEPALWEALGRDHHQAGSYEAALIAFDRALGLQPRRTGALYYRGNLLTDLARFEEAARDYAFALHSDELRGPERRKVEYALSQLLLRQGKLEAGWRLYGARHEAGELSVCFEAPGQPWEGEALDSASLLVLGEQGVGDEVLFANVVPDLIEAVGEGHLTLAVDARLTALFQRSFPQASVIQEETRRRGPFMTRSAVPPRAVDRWAPLGSCAGYLRGSPGRFPSRPRYLIADERRVEAFRAQLAELPGLKVGVTWRSMKLKGERRLQYASLIDWAPILQTPGVSLVNLQYGDAEEELREAEQALSVDIHRLEGVDLWNDLDGVAALGCALDLVIGVSNATFNLAAASGASAWLVTPPRPWPALGTDRWPWYPQVRLFQCERAGEWGGCLANVADALQGRIAAQASGGGLASGGSRV